MPTKMISLRIDEDLLKYLQERADREHRTLSNEIISIIENDKSDKIVDFWYRENMDNTADFYFSDGTHKRVDLGQVGRTAIEREEREVDRILKKVYERLKIEP